MCGPGKVARPVALFSQDACSAEKLVTMLKFARPQPWRQLHLGKSLLGSGACMEDTQGPWH